MKKSCLLGAAVAVILSVVCIGSAQSGTLQHFGYYASDSEWGGHYMDKVLLPDLTRQQDYCNVVHFDITSYYQLDPRRAVIDAANLGYKIILGGDDKFPSYSDKANWQTQFAKIQAAITGYESSILGLLLIDEPNLRPEFQDRSRQEELVEAAKAYFNGKVPIMMNYYGPTLPQEQCIARNLDLVMFDHYVNTLPSPTPKADYLSSMNSVLAAVRAQVPGKPIIIIGNADSWEGSLFPTTEQQQWFYDTASTNSDVIGLIYFMLGNLRVPDYVGAISSPESLQLHRQMGLSVKGAQPRVVFSDRFHTYGTQNDLRSAYNLGSLLPTLTSEKDHGDNGKCVKFGTGAESAERRIFTQNQPGSVSAFLFNKTMRSTDYFAFKVSSTSSNYIMIYASGAGPRYMINDTANAVTAKTTTMYALNRWQKVEFVFDGTGVKVYGDSALIYEASAGWTGGFSKISLCDPWNSTGVGYIDDITVIQSPQAVASIKDAKLLPDGAYISMEGKTATTATGDFDNFFYIEEKSRISGIRISLSPAGVSGLTRGCVVNATGTMGTTTSGERELTNPIVVVVSPSAAN